MPSYFVVYENRPRSAEETPSAPSNVILQGIHPLAWAARQPAAYAQHFVCILLFWAEIPDALAGGRQVQQHFTVEEHR